MSKGKNSVVGIAMGIMLAKIAGGLFRAGRRLAWRWRRVLTPLWVGTAVWFLAVLLRWQGWSGWVVLVLVLPVLGIGTAVLGPRLGDRYRTVVMKLVPEGLDRGTDGVLDRPAERAYFAVLCTWIGTYLAVRIGVGPSEFSGHMWQLGALVLGGLWWWHRRIRVAGKADRFARRWGKVTRGETPSIELRPLMGSKVVRALSIGSIAKLRVRLNGGITPTAVSRCCDALASYMPRMRPGSVFFEPDQNSAQHVWFTFIPKDPWKGKIQHPMPAPGSTSLAELGGRFPMGIYATARELVYRLAHTLVVGQTGSGKSIWLHALIVWLVACRDVVIVGIDMAGGATLNVWRRLFALPIATDPDAAIHILERVLATIETRERQLGIDAEDADDATDDFRPSRDTPWLVLIIDEFPDLIAAGGKPVIQLMGRIGKRARKCGVRLVLAAQNGSKPDVGSKELQAQLSAVVGLGLDPHASKVLWDQLARQGWTSTGLRNGQFLLRDQDHTTPEIAKGFFVGLADRRRTVSEALETGRPVLEPTAWASLMGTGSDSEAVVIDMVTERDKDLEVVIRTIRDEYPDGVRADDLCDLPDMPARATVFRRLKRAQTAGMAESRNGLWHFIPPEQRKGAELTVR